MGAALQAKAIVLSEPLKLGLKIWPFRRRAAPMWWWMSPTAALARARKNSFLMAPCRPFPVCPIPWCLATDPSAESVRRPEARGLGRETGCLYTGANCFEGARGLFGGAASRLVVPAERAIPVDSTLREKGVLLALAATAVHCLRPAEGTAREAFAFPELIVGHGVLGRLVTRLTIALGRAADGLGGGPGAAQRLDGYGVLDQVDRADYTRILEVSGAPASRAP